jgi:hypothetical protein
VKKPQNHSIFRSIAIDKDVNTLLTQAGLLGDVRAQLVLEPNQAEHPGGLHRVFGEERVMEYL